MELIKLNITVMCCYLFGHVCNVSKSHIYYNKQQNIVIWSSWTYLLDQIQTK